MTIDLDVPTDVPNPPRTRRRRALKAGVGVLVAAALLVAVRLGGSPPPSDAPLPDYDNLPGQLRWIASLVDAPPRGDAAADAAFTRDLAGRLEDLSETSESPAFEAGSRPHQVRVLFAADIDERRIALAALQPASVTDAIRRYALTELLWLSGPRGASAETLAGAVAYAGPVAGTEYRLEPAAPFAATQLGDPHDPVWVGLAPPECQVLTAPATDLTVWHDAGPYLVRRPRQDGPEYWRVSCAGTVREQRPAPRAQVSEDDLDAVLANSAAVVANAAAAQPDREQLGFQVSALTSDYGSQLLTLPRLVFTGGVAFSDKAAAGAPKVRIFVYGDEADRGRESESALDVSVTIVAAPAAGEGFIGSVWANVHLGPDHMYFGDALTFVSDQEPGAPHALVAVRLDRWSRQVLVLAPESAATVRIVDEDGLVLDQAPVGEQPVMLAAGEQEPSPDLLVEALDSSGAVITVAPLTLTAHPDLTTDWG